MVVVLAVAGCSTGTSDNDSAAVGSAAPTEFAPDRAVEATGEVSGAPGTVEPVLGAGRAPEVIRPSDPAGQRITVTMHNDMASTTPEQQVIITAYEAFDVEFNAQVARGVLDRDGIQRVAADEAYLDSVYATIAEVEDAGAYWEGTFDVFVKDVEIDAEQPDYAVIRHCHLDVTTKYGPDGAVLDEDNVLRPTENLLQKIDGVWLVIDRRDWMEPGC